MGNKMPENTEDSLALLRNKVKEEVVISDFRRKLIGGISEEDVEDYINTVRKQAEYKENKLNDKIEELISSRDQLKVEYNTYVKNAEEEKKKLQKELTETIQNLEQCKTTDLQISNYEEKYKAELEGLRYELNKVSTERNELKSQLSNIYKDMDNSKAALVSFENEKRLYELQIGELRKELSAIHNKLDEKSKAFGELEEQLRGSKQTEMEHERARAAIAEQLKNEQTSLAKILDENSQLHSKSDTFEKELNDMYNELKSVKEQVKVNYELQQQLEQERLKSERVEKEMTDFFKRIIELKDGKK